MSVDSLSNTPVLGTPLTDTAVRLMLLGAGELGK
jgi:formate-dependent phosphoribosylglycinamide formyltransferase (GAR transformylase)